MTIVEIDWVLIIGLTFYVIVGLIIDRFYR